MSVKVELSLHEVLMAAEVGLMRQIAAIKRKLPDRNGFEGAGWNVHIEGACGELAVAKALGLYWTGSVNSFKCGGDVGAIQVRTRSRADYELIIRDDDRDEDVFVLVTGRCPTYEVIGKIIGRKGKRDEWRRCHGGRQAAWFVPHAALSAIDEREVTGGL
ncbi:hypothetical protein [Bradyrhizobium ivorense]|uniref:hypothetical protein n=1 Tax=Bradyrhizobium ivorense TaxID=2511166 RepID=UPI0010B181FF|nr:hypothetical protein [Bradyrhizobium ivorense]VIO80084.1 hypothetical protein CI41S_70440 [Bradyrhizobium ivorense]